MIAYFIHSSSKNNNSQILSKLNGGRVKQSKYREFGLANIRKKRESILTKNFFNKKNINKVWMSHADQVSKLPKNFNVINVFVRKAPVKTLG